MDDELKERARNGIHNLAELLDSKIDSCETVFRTREFDTETEGDAFHMQAVFVVRCLRNTVRFANFLADKVNEDESSAQFYLSQLRTLTEIAVKSVYVLSLEPLAASRILACEDLITLKKNGAEIYLEYFNNQGRRQYKNLIFNLEYFPKNPDEFTKNKLKKLQKIHNTRFLFPDFKDLLDEVFINQNTPLVQENMIGNLKEVFRHVWESFSEHVHGNHLFNVPQGNEIFWINLHTLVILGTVTEVVDRRILGNIRSADLLSRFREVKPIGSSIRDAWIIKIRANQR